MKLKNIIQIGSFVVAGVAPMTSSTASASDYMCLACPAGTYSNGGSTSCTPCPAGKYSPAASTECKTCPAGTYSASGSGTCTPCPDYHWSSAGASQCGRIQLKLQYWAEQCPNTKYSKWIGAGTNWLCANRTMGGDPCNHKTKFCSVKGMAFVKEDTTFAFDCRKLPCTFTYPDYNRTITLNTDGTITYGGGSFGRLYISGGGNVTW